MAQLYDGLNRGYENGADSFQEFPQEVILHVRK